jgi:cytochrome c oxidase cbb3-type subunit 1
MYAQYGAVMSTIAVEIVVFTVIVNFFMTIKGNTGMLRTNMPLRWFYVGMVNYFLTCFQCAFQTTLTFQKIIHFSDWVVGHAHLVMFGVFGFWLVGATVYLWPKLVGNPWWSEKLNTWNFWISTIGVAVMFIDLMAAGLVQGYLWESLAPWEKSLISSMPFWHVRSLAGICITAGQMLQAFNMWMTARQPARADTQATEPLPAARAAAG